MLDGFDRRSSSAAHGTLEGFSSSQPLGELFREPSSTDESLGAALRELALSGHRVLAAVRGARLRDDELTIARRIIHDLDAALRLAPRAPSCTMADDGNVVRARGRAGRSVTPLLRAPDPRCAHPGATGRHEPRARRARAVRARLAGRAHPLRIAGEARLHRHLDPATPRTRRAPCSRAKAATCSTPNRASRSRTDALEPTQRSQATRCYELRPMRIAVVGTGTGIGKTHTTLALLHALVRRGERAIGLKPIESGFDELAPGRSDGEQLARRELRAALGAPPVRLRAPLTPWLAAEREGAELDLESACAGSTLSRRTTCSWRPQAGCSRRSPSARPTSTSCARSLPTRSCSSRPIDSACFTTSPRVDSRSSEPSSCHARASCSSCPSAAMPPPARTRACSSASVTGPCSARFREARRRRARPACGLGDHRRARVDSASTHAGRAQAR
jgi:hypothetical protein